MLNTFLLVTLCDKLTLSNPVKPDLLCYIASRLLAFTDHINATTVTLQPLEYALNVHPSADCVVGRYLAILGRPIRITVPAVTVAPTALVGSMIKSSNLPHSLQRGIHVCLFRVPC